MALRHRQTQGSDWALADQGLYFVANNATTGTGIAGHAAPVVADTDTKPFLHLFNGGKTVVFPDYALFTCTAAGTGGTINYLTVYIDNKGTTARTGGGTQLTPVSTRSNQPAIAPPFAGAPNTQATIFAGAVTAVMSSSVKVAQQTVREVITVVGDTLAVVFGDPAPGPHSALTTAGTATDHTVCYCPPVAIYPGGNLNISFIRPSQSAAASYEVQFGYFEQSSMGVVS